ncbi:hypothetical protein [Novipirellula rosea]
MAKPVVEYNVGDEYEYRDAEHEYKYEARWKQELNRAPECSL